MPELRDIEEARERIRGRVYLSPCARSETMSRRCGASTYFKLENLQMTGSFKERGALNKILQLPAADAAARRHRRLRGQPRAGGRLPRGARGHRGDHRHAAANAPDQGLEHAPARRRDRPLRQRLRRGLRPRARDRAASAALIAIHPFDDEAVIAGQGTIALELLEQVPDLQAVLVPVGGGGLISGIAIAIKALRPRVKVIGVEAAACPAMKESLEAGKLVSAGRGHHHRRRHRGQEAGRAHARVREAVRRRRGDGRRRGDRERGPAAARAGEDGDRGRRRGGARRALQPTRAEGRAASAWSMILSGGNIDVNILSRIIERGLAKDGRLVRLEVQLSDEPGALAALLAEVGRQSANVIEVHHERTFSDLGLARVKVELTLETRGAEHVRQLEAALRELGASEPTPMCRLAGGPGRRRAGARARPGALPEGPLIHARLPVSRVRRTSVPSS